MKCKYNNNTHRCVKIKENDKDNDKAKDIPSEFCKYNNKTELSKLVAHRLAKKAQEKNIKKIYFDRGSYKYHGRIKAFADTLRENGMEF